jgi:hypothetical protein
MIFVFSCTNKTNIEDIVYETNNVVAGNELVHTVENRIIEKHQTSNITTDITPVRIKEMSGVINQIVSKMKFEKITGTVDLIISMDTSGSMKDEIAFLKTNLKKFIEDINRNLELHLTFVWAENNAANSKYFQSPCYAFSASDAQATHDGKVAQANAYIDAIEIGVNPKQGESPIYWGIKAYAEDTKSCFRNEAHKFLFLMSDEDERPMGDAGSSTPNATEKQNYITTLNGAGIKAYGVIHSGTAKFIKDVVIATAGAYYPFPSNATDLAVSLQSFATDINKIVTGYNISQDPLLDESLEVYINGTAKTAADYTLANDKMNVQFNSGAVEGVAKDSDLLFKFTKVEDTIISIPNASEVKVKVDNGEVNDCAVKEGSSYNLWNCIKDKLVNKASVTYTIYYYNDKETVSLNEYAPTDKTQLKVKLNDTELADGEFTYNGKLVTLEHTKVPYADGDTLSVTYHHENISGGQFSLNLVSPVKVNSIKFNNSEVSEECFDFEMWNPILTIYDCNNIISSVENFDVLINYNTATNEDFEIKIPDDYIDGSDMKVEEMGKGVMTLSTDYSIDAKNSLSKISLQKKQSFIGKQFKVTYLDAKSLEIVLNHRLSDKSWIEVYLNDKVMDKSLYHVRNSKPFAVILNATGGIKLGDKIVVKYSKIQ